jgi:DNA uptake protein ComE-like DNA-binding protein
MSKSAPKLPWWREALTFSRSERIGILLLLMIVVAVWWLPARFGKPTEEISYDIRIDSQIAALPSTSEEYQRFPRKNSSEFSSGRQSNGPERKRPLESFPFDPNTASKEDWLRLGVKERTVGTIFRFLEKGGRFRKPDDITRIYGLSPELAASLKPLVRIPAAIQSSPFKPDSSYGVKRAFRKTPAIIEINESDSALWESLPGIGPTLAGRIVSYRKKLGGFRQIAQVGEIFGLPDSVFQAIKPRLSHTSGESSVSRISVNKARLEDLSAHPYISYRISKAIIAYREQHGPFHHRDDLARIALLTPEIMDRILPYLTFD